MSRGLAMVYFSFNSISYQYISMLDLPSGKNINNDTWNTLGLNATIVYYLCACGYFVFIDLYIFSLVTCINKNCLVLF